MTALVDDMALPGKERGRREVDKFEICFFESIGVLVLSSFCLHV